MGRLIGGIIVGILIVFGGVYFYFTTGLAPAAVKAQPMPLEKYLIKRALHAHLNREEPKAAAIEATPENLLAGAHIYKENCSFCHGLPNSKASAEGGGMYPAAPQLFTKKGMVTDDPAGETFWKVHNGMRMSGMPSFENALNTQQMWQVTLVVKNADKLPPEVEAALAPTPSTPVPAAQTAKPTSSRDHR